jgi:hypothetical protein
MFNSLVCLSDELLSGPGPRRHDKTVVGFDLLGGTRPSTAQAVYKLTIAGEQAGFSVEEMIQMLNAGVTVGTLLQLIEWRLRGIDPSPARSSRWIM